MVIVSYRYSLLRHSRPMYFARVDIKSAFDSIKQDKLLDIIYGVIKSDEYSLQRYCEVNMDQGKARKRYNVRATATGNSSISDISDFR